MEDGIPAIISKSNFQKVQEIMGSRKRAQGRFSAKENYLLSGKLICGECGSHYIGFARKARSDHPYYVNYQCSKKHRAVQCSNTGIAKDDIEHFVLEKISDYVFNDALVPQIIEAYKAYYQNCNSDLHKRFATANNRLCGTEKQIDNIVNVMAQTGSAALVQKLSSLETEKADLKSEISSMEQKLSENQIDEGKIQRMFETARSMFLQGKLSANKTLIDRYIDKIMIYKSHIEIYFNLGGKIKFPSKDFKYSNYNEKKEPPAAEAPSSMSALQRLLSISHSREEIVQKKNGDAEADF